MLRKKKKKSPLKATRLAVRKRRIRIAVTWASVIGAFLVVYGLAWLSGLSALAISDVEVRGHSAVEPKIIEQTIRDGLVGKRAYLFSKANIFLYPKRAIMSNVVAEHKRVLTVRLNVEGRTLVATVIERQPSYVFCLGLPAQQGNKDCYFVDANGYIFSSAPAFSGSAYFVFYGLIKHQDPIGTHYLPENEFVVLDQLVTFAETHNLGAYALLAREDGTAELYLNKGGKIIFDRDQNMDQLKRNIETLRQGTNPLSPLFKRQVEYIDLRFGNKIYFKLIGT